MLLPVAIRSGLLLKWQRLLATLETTCKNYGRLKRKFERHPDRVSGMPFSAYHYFCIMNFLAHAYLSFDNEAVLAGNMISDFVKGNKQFAYPEPVRAGIQLHRSIDSFTDNHPATVAAKQVFRNDYRLYSGAFMDVVYDYFLANDPQEFSTKSLLEFAERTYHILDRYLDRLPVQFQQLFYYMKRQNWLYGYRTTSGLFKSFTGLVSRAQYLTDSRPAERVFLENREWLGEQYRLFWKDLKSFAKQEFDQLKKA